MVYVWSLALLCLWHLLLPLGMRWHIFRWKSMRGFPLSSKVHYTEDQLQGIQKSAFSTYVAFEAFLALGVLSSGVMVLVAALAVFTTIGPLFYRVDLSDLVMHQPLTTGRFLFILSCLGIPWSLFHYVGIPCIRDTHQFCKEMRDCSLQTSVRLRELSQVGKTPGGEVVRPQSKKFVPRGPDRRKPAVEPAHPLDGAEWLPGADETSK